MWKPYAKVLLTWWEIEMGMYLLCIYGEDKMIDDGDMCLYCGTHIKYRKRFLRDPYCPECDKRRK